MLLVFLLTFLFFFLAYPPTQGYGQPGMYPPGQPGMPPPGQPGMPPPGTRLSL